jgi:Uma2 family endonuclease
MSVKIKMSSLSAEEYLEGELHSEVKHELVGGHAYAMVGASNIHNLVSGALFAALRQHLKGSPCRTFMSDMKVRVGDDFYYPDLVVTCRPATGTYYYVIDPVLIVEVLSPTTERQDRLEKRLAYQHLPNLREYVLIAQDKMQVEVHRRIEDGWEIERCGERDELRFESVDLTIPLTEIYQDVMNVP